MPSPLRILRHYYGHVVVEPLFIDQVSAHEVNSRNYLIRCGTPGRAPRFVLKEEVIQDAEALQIRLWKIDLYGYCSLRERILPSLIETDDGKLWALSGDHLYTLMVFCDGNIYDASPLAVVEAARGLARLHWLLRSIGESLPQSSLYGDLCPSEVKAVISKLCEEGERSCFREKVEALVQGDLQSYYEQYQSTLKKSNLPRGLVHYDFHPANAIFRGHRLVAILDMDSIATDFRMQAISFACSRFAGTWGIWHFLGAYNQVDPLTPDEIRFYPLFVRREAVRRINWIIRVNILEGRDLWRGELDKHLNIIRGTKRLDVEFGQSDTELMAKMNAGLLEADGASNTDI